MYYSSNGDKDKGKLPELSDALTMLSGTTQPKKEKEKWGGTKVGEFNQVYYQGNKPLDDLWITKKDVIGKTVVAKPNTKSKTVYFTDWFQSAMNPKKKLVSRKTLFKGSYVYFIPKDENGKITGEPIKLVRVDYTLDVMPDGSLRPMFNSSDTFRSGDKPAYFLYEDVAPAYEHIMKDSREVSEFAMALAKKRTGERQEQLASNFTANYKDPRYHYTPNVSSRYDGGDDYSNYGGKTTQANQSAVKVWKTIRQAIKYKVYGTAGNYQVSQLYSSTPYPTDTYVRGVAVTVVSGNKPFKLIKIDNANFYLRKDDVTLFSGFDGSDYTGLDDIRNSMNKYGAEGMIEDMGADGSKSRGGTSSSSIPKSLLDLQKNLGANARLYKDKVAVPFTLPDRTRGGAYFLPSGIVFINAGRDKKFARLNAGTWSNGGKQIVLLANGRILNSGSVWDNIGGMGAKDEVAEYKKYIQNQNKEKQSRKSNVGKTNSGLDTLLEFTVLKDTPKLVGDASETNKNEYLFKQIGKFKAGESIFIPYNSKAFNSVNDVINAITPTIKNVEYLILHEDSGVVVPYKNIKFRQATKTALVDAYKDEYKYKPITKNYLDKASELLNPITQFKAVKDLVVGSSNINGLEVDLSNMDGLDESIANAIGMDLDLGADGRANKNSFKVMAIKDAPKIVNDRGNWIRKGEFSKGEIKTVVSKERITFYCPIRKENVTRNLYIFNDGTASVPPKWSRYSNADGYNAYSEDSDFSNATSSKALCEIKKSNDIKECDNNYAFNMNNPASAGTAYNTYKLCINSALATYNLCKGKSNFDGDLDFDADYSNLTNQSMLDGLTENTSMLEFEGDYSNLTNESLLDGLTENTSMLDFTGKGKVVNKVDATIYSDTGNYYKIIGSEKIGTVKNVVMVKEARVVLADKRIAKMTVLIFDDKTAGNPAEWEQFSGFEGEEYSNGFGDWVKGLFGKKDDSEKKVNIPTEGDNQVVDGAKADAEFEKSGAKEKGKSFGQWLNSDTGKTVLNVLAQVGLNVLSGTQPKAKTDDNKIITTTDGGGLQINNPQYQTDDKPKEETKILGMSPLVFGLVTAGVITVGAIVTVKLIKSKGK